MTAALRALGFNYVFDTDFAADLTIMEEGTELLDRLSRHLKGDYNRQIPILTSCCPGWVNFFGRIFPRSEGMYLQPLNLHQQECSEQ